MAGCARARPAGSVVALNILVGALERQVFGEIRRAQGGEELDPPFIVRAGIARQCLNSRIDGRQSAGGRYVGRVFHQGRKIGSSGH